MAADSDVEVRLEDQMMINEFGRLQERLTEVREEVKRDQERLENMSDATDEIMLAGDEAGHVKLLVGESFVDVEGDAAGEFVENLMASTKARLAKLQAEMGTILERQGELKRSLYGRFGSNINLEE